MAKEVALVLLSMVLSLNPIQARKPTFRAIDLYGSSQITLERIQQRAGDRIRRFAEAFISGDLEAQETERNLIVSEIQSLGKFAHIDLALVQYPPSNDFYITIDLVDERDRDSRMRFHPAPTKELPDPDRLLALWGEYQRIGFDLLIKGELDSGNMKCPALHCAFGFDHPSLKRFGEVFEQKVPPNKEKLIEIMREDKDPEHRAHAVFLLAHTKDANALVNALLPSMTDPNSTVRNNVMRVLGEIAEKRKEAVIPLEPVLKALDYPDTTDRNKALYILKGLAERPENRQPLIRRADTLIRILRLSQPNNHDFAYLILKKISGKDFGERDYKSWEKWLLSR